MTRLAYSLFLIIFFHSVVQAQVATDSLYLDENFVKTSKSFAAYLQYTVFTTLAKEEGIVKTFYITGEKYSEYPTATITLKATGYYREWHKNGQLKLEQQIEQGVPVGVDNSWFDNGQLFYTFSYTDGKKHGEALTYYKNGARKRIETFDKGVLIEGKCFTVSGQDTTFFPHEKYPEYPGGLKELYQYLGNNVKYPKKAIKQNAQGVVILQFVVAKTGAIENVEVIKSVHPEIDNEAVRLILGMPTWQPGQQEGIFKNVRYTLPVTFKLQK